MVQVWDIVNSWMILMGSSGLKDCIQNDGSSAVGNKEKRNLQGNSSTGALRSPSTLTTSAHTAVDDKHTRNLNDSILESLNDNIMDYNRESSLVSVQSFNLEKSLTASCGETPVVFDDSPSSEKRNHSIQDDSDLSSSIVDKSQENADVTNFDIDETQSPTIIDSTHHMIPRIMLAIRGMYHIFQSL